MFYASDSPETALRETADRPGTFAVGRFETQRDSLILDLGDIPPVPSLFEEIPDSAEYYPRKVLKFLHPVSQAISRPVPRDDRADVNYVPTQVVTEYMRCRRGWDGRAVEGIRYCSSVHPGHFSYVLFATQGNLLPPPPQAPKGEDRWLRLSGRTERSVEPNDLEGWQAGIVWGGPDEEL